MNSDVMAKGGIKFIDDGCSMCKPGPVGLGGIVIIRSSPSVVPPRSWEGPDWRQT